MYLWKYRFLESTSNIFAILLLIKSPCQKIIKIIFTKTVLRSFYNIEPWIFHMYNTNIKKTASTYNLYLILLNRINTLRTAEIFYKHGLEFFFRLVCPNLNIHYWCCDFYLPTGSERNEQRAHPQHYPKLQHFSALNDASLKTCVEHGTNLKDWRGLDETLRIPVLSELLPV